MRKTGIRAYLESKLGEHDISVGWVIRGLKGIAQTCLNPDQRTYAPGAAVRALELLGRHLGMFSSENGSTGRGLQINIDLTQ